MPCRWSTPNWQGRGGSAADKRGQSMYDHRTCKRQRYAREGSYKVGGGLGVAVRTHHAGLDTGRAWWAVDGAQSACEWSALPPPTERDYPLAKGVNVHAHTQREVGEMEEESGDELCDRTAAPVPQVGGIGGEQGCMGAALPATTAGAGEFG
jgi:hypothetical protein